MFLMKTNKLTAKELINTAIFSVVFALIVFVCSMTVGMIPVVFPFLVPICMVPCGIVWVYMRVKTPKAFSILIQCAILTLMLFIVGSAWFIVLGMLVGGVLAEIISGIGKYKNFTLNTIGYAAYGLAFNFGGFALILFAREYYREFMAGNGMESDYMITLLDFFSLPVFLVTTALTIVTAVVGMALGKKLMKKHFEKAGIV